ncbi:LysM peptidoglycan-binding domain-containing protein [Nonomuraea sp. NPDC050536]|uniref:LysM peptidoglycan-binding domain-containing protein n=1 Tax=Nonomuraea sp. NPDC050536 TaxID=3364366 RepID=UPI0037C851F1
MRTTTITHPDDDAQLTLLADLTREARPAPPRPAGRRLWLVPEPRNGSARLGDAPSRADSTRTAGGTAHRPRPKPTSQPGAGRAREAGASTGSRRPAVLPGGARRGRGDATVRPDRAARRGADGPARPSRRDPGDTVRALRRGAAESVPRPGRDGTAGAPGLSGARRRVGARRAARRQACPGRAAGDGAVRLTRRGRIVLVTFFVVLTLGICFAGATATGWAARGAAVPSHAGLPWVVVDQGDTLWKIAQNVDHGDDPARVVAEIVRLNALDDSLIRPGTRLYVPVH